MNKSSMTDQQTEAYYRASEALRKSDNTHTTQKSTVGAFTKMIITAVVAVLALGIFGGFVSIMVENRMDMVGGAYVTDCVGHDQYSGKVPSSYGTDIVAYKNDGGAGITISAGGCLNVAHGTN